MTDVLIDARRGAGSSLEILYGTVTWKPTLTHSRGTSIVLPAPTTYDLVDGQVVATNVQPTPAPVGGQIEWAYEVTFKDRHNKSYSFLVGVPDSTSQVNFISLPRYFESKPPLFGQGPKGVPGESATIAVGTVGSGATPSVTNSGTNTDAILNFVLPKGDKGDTGAGVPTGGTSLQYVRKNSGNTATEWATLNKATVGLSNVDNTSDANKPVSTAQATAIASGDTAAIAQAVQTVSEGLDASVTGLLTAQDSATNSAVSDVAIKTTGKGISLEAQQLDKMDYLCSWVARPTGTTAWTQGFSINEDTQEIYVSAYDYSIGTPAQWFECRNYDGTLKWQTANIPVTSTSAYSEGLPYYYSGTDLCFIIRVDVSPIGEGLVRTYNTVTQTLSAPIAVKGNSKLFADDKYFYCTTSVPSLAQMPTVFTYDRASVISGAPVLLKTTELTHLGAPRQDEKPQGFAFADGYFVATTGKRDGAEPDNGKPGIRLYNGAGEITSTTSFDRLDFRTVLSNIWNPADVHPTGVNYENEGVYPMRDGRLAVMHMLYEKAVITLHGTTSKSVVKQTSPAITQNTGWVEIPLAAGASAYDSTQTPMCSRDGRLVTVRGAFKGATSGSNFELGVLPVGFRPAFPNKVFLMPSNGSAYWRGIITNGGAIRVQGFGGGTISDTSWLPLDFTFRID